MTDSVQPSTTRPKRRRWGWLVLYALAAVPYAVAGLSGAITTWWIKVPLLAIGAAATVFVFWKNGTNRKTLEAETVRAIEAERKLEVAEQREKDAENLAKEDLRKARAEAHGALSSNLDGLKQVVAATSDSRQAQLVASMKEIVLNAAKLGLDVRTAIYRNKQLASGRVLQLDKWRNRENERTTPVREFVEGDKQAGDDMFKMLDEDTDRFVEDVDQAHPEDWQIGMRKDAKTYIAVPIATSEAKFGVLRVDAPKSGDLTREQILTLRLLADAYAVALSINDCDAVQ
ncbi:hypothetical protein [Flindersiella endophytica]